MKYTATKYFRAYDDTWGYYYNKDVIQRQCQQTLKTEEAKELCSTHVLNNCTFSNLLPSNLEKIQELTYLKETKKDNKKVELDNSKSEKEKFLILITKRLRDMKLTQKEKKIIFKTKQEKHSKTLK